MIQRHSERQSERHSRIVGLISALALGLAVVPAFAGLANANTVLQSIITILTASAVAAATIAIMWVGYKCLFTGAQWSDYSRVIIGSIILGGAATIAGLFGL